MMIRRVILATILFVPLMLSQSDLFEHSVWLTASTRARPIVMAFSPTDRTVVVGTDSGKVLLIDLNAGDQRQRIVGQHPAPVVGLSFTRDGSVLASASVAEVMISPIRTAAPVNEIRAWRDIRAIAMSPDGQSIAVGVGNSIVLWDIRRGQEAFHVQSGSKRPFRVLSFRRGGRSLLGVTDNGNICEWDVQAQAIIREVQGRGDTQLAATVSCSGELIGLATETSAMNQSALISGGGAGAGVPIGHPTDLFRQDRINIVDLEDGSVVKTLNGLDGQPIAAAFSTDNRYIALYRRRIRDGVFDIYDLQRGVPVASAPFHDRNGVVAFSRDGRWLGLGIGTGEVIIYSVTGVLPESGPEDLRGVKYRITSKYSEPLISPTDLLRIAVMDFDTNSAEADLGRAVAESVRNRINGTRNVEVVERREWDSILREQNLQASDRMDRSTVVRLGRAHGIAKLIFGSVSRLATAYTINVRMIDVETLTNDGEREVLCQRCSPEDLPGAVALLRSALVKE